MSNTLLNTILLHMLTNLIFTTNPSDGFHYHPHFTDVQTKGYEGCLVQGQNGGKRQSQDFNASFLIPSPVSFLGLYATVSTISIYNTLSLAFYQCTSTSTLHPFQEFSWNLPHLGVFVMFPQHFVYSWNQIIIDCFLWWCYWLQLVNLC